MNDTSITGTTKNLYASKEDVQAAINDENSIIVDVRTLEEYTGKVMTDDASRAGRIPGAIHFEWSNCVNYDDNKN